MVLRTPSSRHSQPRKRGISGNEFLTALAAGYEVSERINNTIGLCVNLAGSNLEKPRTLRGAAAQNACWLWRWLKMTANLGNEWMFLETLYRIYSIPGYNIAHIDVGAKLCEVNSIRSQDVDRIEAVVN
jgi:hypothetical protein